VTGRQKAVRSDSAGWLIAVVWLLLGETVAGAVFWTLLGVPESSGWTLVSRCSCRC
jgi:hypothetical protein